MSRAPHPTPVSDEDLYDAYLDAALAGRLEDPEVFLARHPGAGTTLRERLAGLHAMIRDGRTMDPSLPAAEPLPAEDGLPFERLGGFRLLRHLDEGGMGTVYLAEDEKLSRLVAVKLLRPELRSSERASARFRREAQVLAQLGHPNVVNLFTVGEDRGVAFLAMEYVPGRRLDEVLDDAGRDGHFLPTAEVVEWAVALADGLATAHDAGIVHRDLKPANVLIRPGGRPVLIDFGIARAEQDADLTRTGPFVGSPVYAAPEQLGSGDHEVGPHTDVYGLGATVYECLTGRPPFSGGTTEKIFRRVLADDPEPPRRVNPAVPRDLEVIVLTALEKDPARRYRSAREMADDLEAFREYRPIRARPPNLLSRVEKLARRHPGRASAVATLLLGGLLLAGWAFVSARQSRLEDEREAATLVERAGNRVRRFAGRRRRMRKAERRAMRLDRWMRGRYLTPEEDADLDRVESELSSWRREQEAVFHEVMAWLGRAERLDPDVPGVDQVKADLYAEKFLAARRAGDLESAALYRDLALGSDRSGAAEEVVTEAGTLALTVEPPDVEVHLFRYEHQSQIREDGEWRLVPVPWRGADPVVEPGTWVAEVRRDAGSLRAGDLILEIGGTPIRKRGAAAAREAARRGGEPARVARAGAAFEAALPAGLPVRITATPLPLSDRSRLDPRKRDLPGGAYLLVVRHPQRETERRGFRIIRGLTTSLTVVPARRGATPPGFVRVFGPPDGSVEPFLLMEREVTAGEYLEFLNDPETRATIDASPVPIRFPRSPENARAGGWWPRGEDGRFRLSGETSPDWPIMAVSREDALAYARWKGPVYSLPTFGQWLAAAEHPARTRYVFGDEFRPKWVKSCFAREHPDPEDVLSYPVDESVAGVFDLAGSVQEWSADRYEAKREYFRVTGGSWATGEPIHFQIWADGYAGGDQSSTVIGFRLVRR